MKLRYHINKEDRKIYTLKEKIEGKETKDAHYKFLNLKDVKKRNIS